LSKRTTSFGLVLVSMVLSGTLGCSSKSSTEDTSPASDQENADSNEANASDSQSSRFEQMLYGPVSSQDPEASATGVAAAQWWPAGCATRQRDATNKSVVHVHLNDCSGPFGLVHHTGDITVTFSKNPDGTLHAQATSSNMTVNGKPCTYSGDSDITVDAAAKTLTIRHNDAWTRENAKGETVSHTREGTTVIDAATKCRDTNGSAVTQVANREVDSTLKDYKICRKADGTDGCPTGEMTHTHKPSGKVVTIEFDGSAEAKVTGPKGNSTELPLVCIP
jgi:hypothetical protein